MSLIEPFLVSCLSLYTKLVEERHVSVFGVLGLCLLHMNNAVHFTLLSSPSIDREIQDADLHSKSTLDCNVQQ